MRNGKNDKGENQSLYVHTRIHNHADYFDKLYGVMNDVEKRQFIEALISEIQIFEDRQPNGQWLKSIKFKLPIIEEDMSVGLDDNSHVECVVLMSRITK